MRKISIQKKKRKQLPSGGILVIAGLLLSFVFISCNQTDKSPLHDFQKRRLEALKTLGKTPVDQLQPIKLEVTTTAEQRSGVRRIRIRGHQIISDSGYDFAGYSLGPGSPESTLTVLASDIADTYLSQAAFKGVPPYLHNIRYTLYVSSPHTDKEIEALRDAVEAVCPIYSLYISEQKIEGRIVRENFDSYRLHPQYYTDSRN